MSSPFAQYLRPPIMPNILIPRPDDSAPVLLDLFCKAGGAAVGYAKAGFRLVGVDIEPQPHYPYEFIQADALAFLRTADLSRFSAIHASPPCQRFSVMTPDKCRDKHPDLIGPIRQLLIGIGKPYVIENVMGSPLRNPIRLCGTMFPPLRVYRHRLFESDIFLKEPNHSPHNDSTPRAGRGMSPKGFISVAGKGGGEPTSYWYKAMGIEWMTLPELVQAIPPAYTEWIGGQLMGHLRPETLMPT